MAARWGGARSLVSHMRGLQTRYENGTLCKASYRRALLRAAQHLESHKTGTLRMSKRDLSMAKIYRRRADDLNLSAEE